MKYKRFALIVSLFILLLTCISTHSGYSAETAPVDKSLTMRHQFHRKIKRLQAEMFKADVPKEAVLRILGKPDEVRVGDERDSRSVFWCYGVDKPGTYATLGKVAFDDKGKVRSTTGNYDAPSLPSNLISEAELRQLLCILHDYDSRYGYSNSFHAYCFEPLPLVRTVNTLLPFGKEKVLLAVEEYSWLRGTGKGLRSLLLALFEIPTDRGYLPRFKEDYPGEIPSIPSEQRYFPRYPLVIINDVPISVLLESGISGSWIEQIMGKAKPNIDWFKTKGKWRSKLLIPSDDPLSVLKRFMLSKEYLHLYGKKMPDGSVEVDEWVENRLRLDVQRQLLRIVSNAYPYQEKYETERGSPLRTLPKEDWERMCQEFSQLNVRWDAKRQNYVRSGSQ